MSEQEKEQPTEQPEPETNDNVSTTYAGDVAEAEVIHADGTRS